MAPAAPIARLTMAAGNSEPPWHCAKCAALLPAEVSQPAPGMPRLEIGGEAEGRQGTRVEESFVLLHAADVAMTTEHGEANASQDNAGGMEAHFRALERLFKAATEVSEFEHPLCSDCSRLVLEELTRQAEDAEDEAAAYEAAAARLASAREASSADDDAASAAAAAEAEAEEAREEARCRSLRAELAAVEAELQSLRGAEASVQVLEEAHHHALNAHHLELHHHLEERDSVLRQLDTAHAQLQVLRHANVFDDAFHIWHDGSFGTFSGFRLGRLPGVNVEWDEINAAWGQACLLLQSLANHCRVTFTQHRLLPMGSTPRIADRKGVYELYGPVNVFWSVRYDRAMVGFLTCLDELGAFARSRDLAHGVAPNDAFALPHRIEGDRIDGKTIKLSMNRNELWTAALKLMLSDLKAVMAWCCGAGAGAPAPA